jgi:hypothetical protein
LFACRRHADRRTTDDHRHGPGPINAELDNFREHIETRGMRTHLSRGGCTIIGSIARDAASQGRAAPSLSTAIKRD